jgi:hypothetical protein
VVAVGIAARESVRNDRRDGRAAAIIALSLMMVALWYSFLRGNLGARLGEVGPPVVVLAAWLLSLAMARRRRWWEQLLTGPVALVALIISLVCAWQLGSVSGELRSARLLEPQDMFAHTRKISQDLAGMPRALREAEAAGRMQASDYLYRCTRPSDRVIAIGYYADVLAFTERLFAAGRATFVIVYYMDERYQRETLATLKSQSVPIVLAGRELDLHEYRALADYVHAHYDNHGEVVSSQGPLRVWTRRGLTGTPSGPNGLPCFG